jgi:heme A synthase
MTRADSGVEPRRFAAFAWAVLAYNILVILWGMVVRATGSGSGCGEHWPLCQGAVIPHAAEISTLIEFAHRVSSGIAVLLVAALVLVAFRRFPKGHAVRPCAAAALLFTFTEGLIGAALVLFGETGGNASLSRVLILSLHLVNTFLLLAALAMTSWSAREAPAAEPRPSAGGEAPATPRYAAYIIALAGTLALAVSGTVTALADTLFPASTPMQGFRWDFSSASNLFLRLRIIHPAFAVVVGGYLLILAASTLHGPASGAGRRLARVLLVLVSLQMSFGALNILLLTPLWMQTLHLLTADLIWVTLVLLSAEMLRPWNVFLSAADREYELKPEGGAAVERIPASK